MKNFKRQAYLIAGIACLGLSSGAKGAAIGTLSEANCSGGGVTVSATTITWLPPTMSGTAGCIDSGAATSMTYSGGGGGTLGPGVTGNILDLTIGGGTVNDFMTFAVPTAYTLDFELTGLGPGVANTNCALNGTTLTTCSPGGGPFILTYVSANVTGVALAAFGTIADGGVTSNWDGSFTTQLNDSASTIASLEANGGSITSANSGNFTASTVPEPGTVSLFLGGLALLGIGRRFRKS